MAVTTLPRTSHRVLIKLVIALVAAAVIVTALLVARTHHSGTATPSTPGVAATSVSTPGVGDDCFTIRRRGLGC
jgi:hypothetical protein